MLIETKIRYHLMPVRWPSSKSLHIIDARNGAEKREPTNAVGVNVNWCNHYGEQYGSSLKN